jgi:hypothetical protein
MNKQGVTGFNKGGAVGVQRFQFGGAAAAGIADPRGSSVDSLLKEEKARQKNTKATEKDTKQKRKNTDQGSKLGSAFGNLAGAGLSLSFGISAINQAFEDGELAFTELINIAFLVGPAVGTMIVGLKEAALGLKEFAAKSKTNAAKLGVGAGAGLVGGVLLASGAGGDTGKAVGTGLVAFAAALTILPAPLAAVVGLLVTTGSAVDSYLKSQDKVPEKLKDISDGFDQLSKDIDKKPFDKLVKELARLRKQADIEFGDRFGSDVSGSLGGSFTATIDTIFRSFEDADWGAIGNIAIDAFGTGFLAGLPQLTSFLATGEVLSQNLGDSAAFERQLTRAFTPARYARIAAAAGTEFEKQSLVLAQSVNKGVKELDEETSKSVNNYINTLQGLDLGQTQDFGIQSDNINFDGILDIKQTRDLQSRVGALSNIYQKTGIIKNVGEANKEAEKVFVTGLQANAKGVTEAISKNKSKFKEAGIDNLEIGRALQGLTQAGTVGQAVGSINELVTLFKRAGVEFDVAGSIIDPTLSNITQGLESGLGPALDATKERIFTFNRELEKLADTFSFALEKVGNNFDNISKDIDLLLRNSSELNLGRAINPFEGGGDTAARQAGITAIEQATGQDLSAARTLDAALQEIEGFTRDFVASGQELVDASDFITAFEDKFKTTLPKDISDSITLTIANGLKRQGGASSLAVALEESFKSGDLLSNIKDASDTFNEGLSKSFDAINSQFEQIEKLVKQQLKIDQARLKNNLKIIDTERKFAEQRASILKIEQSNFANAQQNLRNRLSATGVSPTATAGDLGAERSRLLARRQQLRGELDVTQGGRQATAADVAELKFLSSQLESNTQALTILSDRTQELSGIQKDIAQEQRKRAQAEAGLDELIDAVASGDREAQQELNKRLFALSQAAQGRATAAQAVSARRTAQTELGGGLLAHWTGRWYISWKTGESGTNW